MGHDTRHPLRNRLTRALAARTTGTARCSAFPPPPPVPDNDANEASIREWVLRHHARYGLDPIWILTGIGPGPDGTRPQPQPVTPVYAMSAVDPRSGDWRPEVVDRIRLGPELIGQGQFVIRMEDRSMEPRIRCGAYLIVDPGQVRLPEKPTAPRPVRPDGHIFALNMPGEGLVVRLTQVEKTTERVELVALAECTPPLFLSREAADRLLQGRVVRLAQNL